MATAHERRISSRAINTVGNRAKAGGTCIFYWREAILRQSQVSGGNPLAPATPWRLAIDAIYFTWHPPTGDAQDCGFVTLLKDCLFCCSQPERVSVLPREEVMHRLRHHQALVH
jgi:hypothetical protein